MPVWKTDPVHIRSEIMLSRWRIIGLPDGARHLVGYNRSDAEGRVSSALDTFDPDRLIGRTRSGRIYQLVGEPSWDADAAYVLDRWSAINKVDPGVIRSLTVADLADLGPLE